MSSAGEKTHAQFRARLQHRASRPTVRRRIGWGAADQVFSSLTNFLLSIMVARTVTTREFGVFGVLFVSYLLVLGFSRALSSDVLVVRFSATSRHEWRLAAAVATGTAAAVGIFAAGVGVIVAIAIGGSFRTSLLALAVALPGILVQDCWRFAFFARGTPRSAFVNDSLAALVLVLGLLVLAALHVEDLAAFFLAWGGSATFAAAAGCLQADLRPRLHLARGWMARHRDLALPYAGDFLSYFGGSQLVTYVLAALGGLSAAAAIRGAGVMLGPLNVLFMGIGNIAIPEGVRRRSSRHALQKWTLSVSFALTTTALAWTAVIVLLPNSVGHAVLGDTWAAAQPVLLPLGLAMAGSGLASGAIGGLRALGEARTSLRARLISTPLILAAASLGATFGTVPAVGAMALAQWVTAVGVWWRFFLRALPPTHAEGAERRDPAATTAWG